MSRQVPFPSAGHALRQSPARAWLLAPSPPPHEYWQYLLGSVANVEGYWPGWPGPNPNPGNPILPPPGTLGITTPIQKALALPWSDDQTFDPIDFPVLNFEFEDMTNPYDNLFKISGTAAHAVQDITGLLILATQLTLMNYPYPMGRASYIVADPLGNPVGRDGTIQACWANVASAIRCRFNSPRSNNKAWQATITVGYPGFTTPYYQYGTPTFSATWIGYVPVIGGIVYEVPLPKAPMSGQLNSPTGTATAWFWDITPQIFQIQTGLTLQGFTG